MPECQEMPRYKCHKVVHALKIGKLDQTPEPDHGDPSAPVETRDGLTITPSDKGYAPFFVGAEWCKRYDGGNDLGYYVVYEDGFASWSPTKAFEDGYARL